MNMQENIQGVKINLTRGHDVDHTKTIASFFSGYGGLEMGIKSALGGKCRTIFFVEREAFAVANLVAKIEAGLLDAAPIYTDVTTFPYGKFRGLVDIACGGVPCQPHSVAGKRKGGNDERFLFDIFFDGLQEMQPRQIFIENVEGLLTSRMPDGSLCFKYIVERLEKMDYRVKTGLFTAAEVGAPHRRKRVFILANARCFRQEIGQVQTAGIVESGEILGNAEHDGLYGSEIPRGITETVQHNPKWKNIASESSRAGNTGELAYTDQQGSQGRYSGKLPECSVKWPARPGSPQYHWEEPRVTQPGLGGAINGTSSRVDRLRLLGNGVVPQQAARAWTILNEEIKK